LAVERSTLSRRTLLKAGGGLAAAEPARADTEATGRPWAMQGVGGCHFGFPPFMRWRGGQL